MERSFAGSSETVSRGPKTASTYSMLPLTLLLFCGLALVNLVICSFNWLAGWLTCFVVQTSVSFCDTVLCGVIVRYHAGIEWLFVWFVG